MTSKAGKQKREGCYCSLEMRQPYGIGVLVTRFERGSKGFVNTQVLRSGEGIEIQFGGSAQMNFRREENLSLKNLPSAVKFSLQENESDYKVTREDPAAERFVDTGVLLLFQGIA